MGIEALVSKMGVPVEKGAPIIVEGNKAPVAGLEVEFRAFLELVEVEIAECCLYLCLDRPLFFLG